MEGLYENLVLNSEDYEVIPCRLVDHYPNILQHPVALVC